MCLPNPAHPRVLHGRWYKVRMSHKDAIVSLMGTYSYISQWYSISSDLKRHMSYLSSLVRHKKLYKSMVYLLTLLFTTSTVKQLYCSTVASGGAPVNDLVWFELLLTNKDETVFHEHCSIVTKLLQTTDSMKYLPYLDVVFPLQWPRVSSTTFNDKVCKRPLSACVFSTP